MVLVKDALIHMLRLPNLNEGLIIVTALTVIDANLFDHLLKPRVVFPDSGINQLLETESILAWKFV